MKKYSWIVALILALSFTIFFTGCGVDPVEGGGGAFSTTDISGKLKAWGDYKPTITGNKVAFDQVGKSSQGFYFNFADIGYDFSRNDILVISYEATVETAEANFFVKNASTNTWSDPKGSYGVGNGWEYFIASDLNDGKNSTYTGSQVSASWDKTSKKGWFEVKLANFPAGTTALGFQNNPDAEFPGGNKVATNSKYTITITKIENKVGAPAEPEFDYAAFNKAVSIPAADIEVSGDPLRSVSVGTDGTIYRTPPLKDWDSTFSVKLPTFVETLGATDKIAVNYHAILEKGTGEIKLTAKQGTGGTDLSPATYISLTGDGRLSQFTVDVSRYTTEPTTGSKIYFQSNDSGGNGTAVWKIKIVSIEILRGGKKPVTLRDITFAAPAAGKIPADKIIDTAQYTGSIAWTGTKATKKVISKDDKGKVSLVSPFDKNVNYTPAIILTAKDGFVFNSDQIGATVTNAFRVNGTAGTNTPLTASNTTFTVTGNAVGSGNVSDAVVSQKAITGITVPSAGATPFTDVTSDATTGLQKVAANNTQYRVKSIAWKKAEDDSAHTGAFDAETVYYAEVELESLFGYTFVGATGFTATGAKTVVPSGADAEKVTLTITYPATEKTIDSLDVKGLKAPVGGATPVRSISSAQYTGTVRWFVNTAGDNKNDELVSGTFKSGVQYRAIITLTPKSGWTLRGITANAFTVEGATATNSANAGVINAVF